MRKRAIEIGTEYAVSRDMSKHTSWERATVVGIDEHGSWPILVQFEGWKGTKRTDRMSTAQVRQLWSEYEPIMLAANARHRARRDEAKAKKEAASQTRLRLAHLLSDHGIVTNPGHITGHTFRGDATLSESATAALIKFLEETS